MVKRITLNEPLLACQNELGEGCLWDSKRGLLHWVDIKRSEVHTLEPNLMAHSIDSYASADPLISAISLRTDSPGFIASFTDRLAFLPQPATPTTPGTISSSSSGPSSTASSSTYSPADTIIDRSSEITPLLFHLPPSALVHPGARFNDGASDRLGRFWIGSTAIDEEAGFGHLYRYDPDGSSHVVLENIGCSNGIGWSPNDSIMYYIDSGKKTIQAWDFDLVTGEISNGSVLADANSLPQSTSTSTSTTKPEGTYDGLCMDSSGCVWSARWGDSKVVRINPDGKVDMEILIPNALNITCCVFGGPDLSDLYITTASANQSYPELVPQYPQGGDLFRVRIDGVKGVERFKFAG